MRKIKENKEILEKKVEEYLKKPYKIQLEYSEEDNVYLAEVVELPGCISYGETEQEALEMIKDAMRAWIYAALKRGKEIPEPIATTKYSGKFLVRISRSLHKELVELAKTEGVSLNQLVAELLSTGLIIKKNRYTAQILPQYPQKKWITSEHYRVGGKSLYGEIGFIGKQHRRRLSA